MMPSTCEKSKAVHSPLRIIINVFIQPVPMCATWPSAGVKTKIAQVRTRLMQNCQMISPLRSPGRFTLPNEEYKGSLDHIS